MRQSRCSPATRQASLAATVRLPARPRRPCRPAGCLRTLPRSAMRLMSAIERAPRKASRKRVRRLVQRAELEDLGDQQGPGEDRGQDQADHDDLNDRRRRPGTCRTGVSLPAFFMVGSAAASAAAAGVGGSGGGRSGGGVSGRSGRFGGGRRRGGSVLSEGRRARHQRHGADESDEGVFRLVVEHLSPVPGWSSTVGPRVVARERLHPNLNSQPGGRSLGRPCRPAFAALDPLRPLAGLMPIKKDRFEGA